MAITVRPAALRDQPPSVASRLSADLRERAAVWWTEWRWPVRVGLLLLVVLEIPFRLAAGQSANGLHFGGMLWAFNDPPQYYSAMRQGAASAGWLIYDRFTAEAHSPALIYPLYVMLGKVAGLLGLRIEQTFLDASLLGRAFLLAAIYFATGLVSEERTTRRVAFLLVATSSGIGTLLALLQALAGLPISVAWRDREDPDLNSFVMFLTAPHLMIGLGLLLSSARLYADCWGQRRPWRLFLLAVAVAALGLTNPFPLLPFVAAVGLHAVAMTVIRRQFDWAGIGAAAVAVLSATPSILVNAATFVLDPFWSLTYGKQNVQLTPPAWEMAEAFGLLIPLIALGLRSVLRQPTPGRTLVIVWVLGALVLMQLPFGTQRRSGAGLHAMLALLAAPGAVLVWGAFRRWKASGRLRLMRPLVVTTAAQGMFGTSVLSYAIVLTVGLAPSLGRLAPDVPGADRAPYQPAAMVEVANWLTANASPADVVFGSVLTGNYLAGAAHTRSYVGHWVATLEYGAKVRQAHWFYGGRFDAERLELLRSSRVAFVVYGPHERKLGATPGDAEGLEPVFRGADIELFRVLPTEGRTPY